MKCAGGLPGFPFLTSFRSVSVLLTLWVMCAQHGLRMDNTGVLAMNVKLHIMIGFAQSFGVGQSFSRGQQI